MKRVVYHIVGTTSILQDKLKELLEDLIQNQDYTEEEGKRIVDEFFFGIKTNVDGLKLSTQLKIDELLKRLKIDSLISLRENIETIVKDIEENPLVPILFKQHQKQ